MTGHDAILPASIATPKVHYAASGCAVSPMPGAVGLRSSRAPYGPPVAGSPSACVSCSVCVRQKCPLQVAQVTRAFAWQPVHSQRPYSSVRPYFGAGVVIGRFADGMVSIISQPRRWCSRPRRVSATAAVVSTADPTARTCHCSERTWHCGTFGGNLPARTTPPPDYASGGTAAPP